jgi:hypothetical protein
MAARDLSPRDRAALAKHVMDVDRRTQWLVIVEALRSRDFQGFVTPFLSSPALAIYLAGRLRSEVQPQINKWLKRLVRH